MKEEDDQANDFVKLAKLAEEISSVSDSISANTIRISKILGNLGKQVGEEFRARLPADPDYAEITTLGLQKIEREWGLIIIEENSRSSDDVKAARLTDVALKKRLAVARHLPVFLSEYLNMANARLTSLSKPAAELEAIADQIETAMPLPQSDDELPF